MRLRTKDGRGGGGALSEVVKGADDDGDDDDDLNRVLRWHKETSSLAINRDPSPFGCRTLAQSPSSVVDAVFAPSQHADGQSKRQNRAALRQPPVFSFSCVVWLVE
jgi:hypothetical protein